MDIKLDISQTFTTDGGESLICYDKSEKFAFLCPYELKDDNTVILNVANTKVYSLEEGQTPVGNRIFRSK